MKFYLTPSNQLFCLLLCLYLSMFVAVQLSSLSLLYKLLLAVVIIWYGLQTIQKHALRNIRPAPLRICYKDGIWHIADRTGYCVSGKLNKCTYINKLLIILSVKPQKSQHKTRVVLITQDSLPALQFRRLSMLARS